MGANPQIACRKIFSLTKITPESNFGYEIFPGIINDNQNQSLHDKKRETNCFATHILEQGGDLRYIQKILGHKNLKTTEFYTHITSEAIRNIKSPLDNLEIEKGKSET